MLTTNHSAATETYLSRLTALLLLTVTLFLFFASTPSATTNTTQTPTLPHSLTPSAPTPAHINILTASHILTFIYIYTHYSSVTRFVTPGSPTPNTTGLSLGLVGYGALSVLGIWCVVFGTGSSHRSRRTGADKRTSGWLFKNEAAYDKKRDYAKVGKST